MSDTIHRGLDGVNIDASSISSIDGLKGELVYRGYDIRELADHASFEETNLPALERRFTDRARTECV